MRSIAVVCPAGILSGKEIMVLQLVEALGDVGMNVEVVSSHWTDGRFAQRLAQLQVPTQKVWFGFISANLSPRNVYMTLMQLGRLPQLLMGYGNFLRRFRPDKVIHTNWHSLLAISPFLRPSREIYWVHEVMPDKPQYRTVFRWLDRRLNCFVAVSQAVADSLIRIGIARDKIRVIHNGIDNRRFLPRPIAESGDALTIGIVGQVGAWKGHEDLLEAFARVATDFPTARLKIYGKGAADYEDLLKRKTEQLGLTKQVDWCGYVPDPNQIYRGLSILVVPSRSADALPTVAIEAAFFEVPVVASSQGGLNEIVVHRNSGFLFPTGDVENLAEILRTLLLDRSTRTALARNALARAKQLFARERFVQSFVEILAN